MSRVGLIGAAFSMAVVGWSVDAHAITILANPFGNAPVTAYIGSDADGQWIGWQNKDTSACTWGFLGGPTGLSDNYQVHGGSGADAIIVVSTPVTFCGFPIVTPVYNGHFVDLFGNGGNDNVWSATTLDTWVHGGTGNDWVISARADSVLDGDAGNDLLFASGVGSGGHKRGGDGNDCLNINPSLTSPTMSCGTGTDRWSGPGSRPADCETTQTNCCGFCL